MESFTHTAKDKRGLYEEVLPQIESLISGEEDLVANLANVAAVLKEAFGFFWVGFYLVRENTASETGINPEQTSTLVLGPFQGPLACTRIKYGRGVCGSAWAQRKTLVVPDVDAFPGHIACSSASRSEIVVPLILPDGTVLGVLDIDSDKLSTFDATDAEFLERLANTICKNVK